MRTVDSQAPVEMTVTAPLRHLCPFVDEVDEGTVTVTWAVDGTTHELHALADYLRGWKDSTVSHEEITDRIAHDLQATGLHVREVTTAWTTAGMEVRCSTSPTPAVQP